MKIKVCLRSLIHPAAHRANISLGFCAELGEGLSEVFFFFFNFEFYFYFVNSPKDFPV